MSTVVQIVKLEITAKNPRSTISYHRLNLSTGNWEIQRPTRET